MEGSKPITEDVREANGETGFYVEPKKDCPHLKEFFTPDINKIAANAPCEDCGHRDENWVCLTCSKRFCSRYVKGHMVSHNEASGHQIAASYSDLSVWCYACESYITHPTLANLLKRMSMSKFGDAGTGGRYTAHKTVEQMVERHDEPEVLQQKIKQLADMIRESKHCIAFTGAGISTSAGVPDFRGPQGVWTLAATGGKRTERTVPMLSALPTPSHMGLVKLQDQGILKYLISQNVDGLHRRSGILPENISELHGNSNIEVCEICGKEYLRDFSTSDGASVRHYTGRTCSVANCGGLLLDTIVGFGESLPFHVVQRSYEHSELSDLCLCLGSSLTVAPANDMPRTVAKKGGNMVIVNLQNTPLDSIATLRIYGKCDEVMEGVMKELQMDIPPFLLRRRVNVAQRDNKLSISVIDVDGTPMSIFSEVALQFGSGKTAFLDLDSNGSNLAFVFDVPEGEETVEIRTNFMGHYNEPTFTLQHVLQNDTCKKLLLSYDPSVGQWSCEERSGEEGREEEEASASTCNDAHIEKMPDRVLNQDHEHELHKCPKIYQGAYRCNKCLKVGVGWVYTCKACQYDLHPGCAIWRRH
ncbi:Deacetylase sirtuin-type domain-containing protein [Balamuthia mandrillaris]